MCLAGCGPAWHMVGVRQVVPMLRFVASRIFLGPFLLLALVMVHSPAKAQIGSAEAQAEAAVAAPRVAELAREGYQDIKVEWTWLGRLRIVAWLDGQRREIVLHPTTGEVLRDLSLPPATAYAQGSDDVPGTAQAGQATATASAIAAGDGAVTTVTRGGGAGDVVTDPAVSALGDGTTP